MSGTETFDQGLKAVFEADRGAYSVVTATEAGDGQVTVSSDEKKLIIDFFGEAELKKYQGNDSDIEAAGLDARHEFRLWPTGEIVRPKLKYPKPGNSELRLYFNNDEFKVRKGHYWGVFERSGEIWIFKSPKPFLDGIRSGDFSPNGRGQSLEDELDDYQMLVNSTLPSQSETTTKSWDRNPKVASAALIDAGYKCELYPELPTFRSRSTGKPFVEAHHLIPMKLQANFGVSLDIEENICALSPFAHRKIHLAGFDDIAKDVLTLIDRRPGLLEYVGTSADEVLGFYRV
jgi:hypothetical protein